MNTIQTTLQTNRPPVLAAGSFRLFLLSLCLAASLSGCSTVKTHVDKGPIPAHTFSFLNTGAKATPSYAEDRKEAHVLVQGAIIKDLAQKGVNQVPTGGEVTVAYLIVVGNNVSTTALNDYFGYTPDSEALLEKVHSEETAKDQNRGYFESGTLVIDFLDPKTSKVLQRRSIQAPVLRNLPLENRNTRVQSIVDQALADVRFTK